ncbi:hypothetical protein GCM10023191_002290 [Actinoallomurus oryzae]|uniref:Condensation domain-containing protein n=1 Tax=Actinoallomurus oryzae TaxID=502180 RepID=A0ABP8P5N8_9ACTN
MSELPPAVAERVRELVDRGVEVWADGDGLCFLAPPDVPAADVRSVLRPAREGLMSLLAGGERLAPALLIERGRVEYAGEPSATRTLIFEITGPLDLAALQAALTALVARHDALRVAYPRVGGGRVRLVHPPMPVPVPCFDGDEPRHPPRPDPGRPPLLTAALVRRGPAAHLLALTVHTLAVDGMSLALLLEELGTLYDAAEAGRPPALPEAPSSGRQVRRERAYLAGPEAAAAREYWATRLASAAALRGRPGAPQDGPGQVGSVPGKAGHVPIAVPERLMDAVRARAAAEGTTSFAVLLAAYGSLLAEVTGCEDVTVAVPIGNRWHPEDEHTVSGARDLLLLRLALDGTLPDAIAVTHRERREAMAHGRLPFEALPPGVAPPRRPGRNPVFGAVFALQTFDKPLALRPRRPSVTLRHLTEPPPDAGIDFKLILWPQDGGLRGELACDGAAADAGELPGLGRRYLAILGELAERRPGRIRPEDVRGVLQADPAVAETVLDEREGRVVVYVRLHADAYPVVIDRLRRGLSVYHPAPLLVPVRRVPRHAGGGADIAALRRVPVTDPATLARWEAELAARARTAVEVEVASHPIGDEVCPPGPDRREPVAAQQVTVTMPACVPEDIVLLDRFGTEVVPRTLTEEGRAGRGR